MTLQELLAIYTNPESTDEQKAEAMAAYEKDGKLFLIYANNMNSSDAMVKKLEGILFGLKEMIYTYK